MQVLFPQHRECHSAAAHATRGVNVATSRKHEQLHLEGEPHVAEFHSGAFAAINTTAPTTAWRHLPMQRFAVTLQKGGTRGPVVDALEPRDFQTQAGTLVGARCRLRAPTLSC